MASYAIWNADGSASGIFQRVFGDTAGLPRGPQPVLDDLARPDGVQLRSLLALSAMALCWLMRWTLLIQGQTLPKFNAQFTPYTLPAGTDDKDVGNFRHWIRPLAFYDMNRHRQSIHRHDGIGRARGQAQAAAGAALAVDAHESARDRLAAGLHHRIAPRHVNCRTA